MACGGPCLSLRLVFRAWTKETEKQTMNILAALLLIGASGSATRSLESEQSIAGIIAGVVAGGVKDAVGTGASVGDFEAKEVIARLQAVTRTASLAIDGEPRTGWRAWGEAAIRVAYYAVATDDRREGFVQYSYIINLREYSIQRRTAISDGCVTLTTDIWWTERVPVGRQVREIPIHVRVTIRADERDLRQTRIMGTATGHADTRDFRCPIVRRIAERQAAATLQVGLAEALHGIESTGRGWYDAVELPDWLGRIGGGIRAVGRARR